MRKYPNNSIDRKIAEIFLIVFSIFTFCIILLIAFLPFIPHKKNSINQHTETTFPKNSSLRKEMQAKNVENFIYDLASSSTAHTAQLTLISILLGVIVGALLAGLPKDFVLNLWSWGNLDIDFRVLATFLATIDLWMKYSWGIIVVRWPFSLLHDVIYSIVSGSMLGFALSVANLNAWLAWGAATCFAAFAAYMLNMYIVFKEKRHRKKHSHKKIASEDPPPSVKDLVVLRNSSIGEALLVLLPGIPALYGALNNYHLLPASIQWKISFPTSIGWGEFIVLFVIVDMMVQGLIVMPKQRYGRTTTSSKDFYYADEEQPVPDYNNII